MNQRFDQNCERFEAMIPEWFEGTLVSSQREELTVHMASCASCRESFALTSAIENELVARRSLVPSFESFMPAMAESTATAVHPRLLRVFRTVMSPAGISIAIIMW